jgi:integrase
MAKARLTDRMVALAKAEAGERLELWDSLTPGLALRVSDQGRKVWVVRYRTVDGRQPRFTLGTYPGLELKEARELARTAAKDARGGDDPAARRRLAGAAAKAQPIKTLTDLAECYFAACESGEWQPKERKKRASTLAEERGRWRRHLKGELGGERVEDITPDAIRKLLRAIVAKGHGVTSNRVRSLLRQMFNFAIAEERVILNPVAKVRPLGTEQARGRVLSDAEIKTAWRSIIDPSELRKPAEESSGGPERVYIGPAVSIALRLLLLTMTRRAEVAGMRLDELDLAQAAWTIPGSRTKNGQPLFVPLSPDALALINEALQLVRLRPDANSDPSPFVFPSPRTSQKPITPGSLSHALRELRIALGGPRFTPHDFRRAGATLMTGERLGISPFLVGRILNHTTERGGAAAVTVTHYALNEYAAEKRRALQAWADLLAEIVGTRPATSNVARMARA